MAQRGQVENFKWRQTSNIITFLKGFYIFYPTGNHFLSRSVKTIKKYQSIFVSTVHLNLFSKTGLEESIVNAPRITDHGSAVNSNLTFALFVFLFCKLTIDFSTSTLRRHFN
jgi:hypothetical protein